MEYINGIEHEEILKIEELRKHIGETVKIHGFVYKIRKMKGFAFIILRTSRRLVQCIYSEEFSEFTLSELMEESCINVIGTIVSDTRSKVGYEIQMKQIEILSTPNEESPVVINNKSMEMSLDTLLNSRPITLRNEKERAIFKIQAGICKGFRSFLEENQFTEIHTPKIVATGAEGGANIFPIEYFKKEAYLAQSPQFYKQMMVGVFERVYEIAPVFRAEKHDTSRHLNEYTSVDFEMGFIESYVDIMKMETRMIYSTLELLKEEYRYELELLKVNIPSITEIPTIKFMEAKQLIAKEYRRDIQDYYDFEPEEEKLLSECIKKITGSDFVFVTHYPSEKRPFYAMDDKNNKNTTLSFDLLFRGLEITTGGQRIHNYKEQMMKLKSRSMNAELFESYLMMHKHGMPPHGGLGLGLERFTARLLELENVRYATLFPRDINRVTP
ncbi:aspartate--tRNA(Asn) ligase [Anaeromicropila herbilytica]|uniref:Aspartate--tRNA ligase n=1 Tax=Anaeromicropila herbilytica TaxID=2785025 RepID=A0A7R7EL72_9FIRM|nr:aspartate--tRNA(Asn) ligase [Anaeromicropila herbilytica]BCN30646.1 aspartate--tRNA(Asn) ligase [Anaeromicropila herbilytica]